MLRFVSTETEAHALAARQPFPIPWSVSNNRIADMNMVRKAQCHAGWDWGPCLMVLGVYADPKLHLFDGVRIEHAVIRQKHHDGGKVTVTAEVEIAAVKERTIPVIFTFGGATASANVPVTRPEPGSSLSVDLDKPALWWPAGHGEQPLHDAVIAIPGDRVERRVGLRTLEVVNQPDEIGTSLFFRVNGIDIFCKGANWIPADALPARITRDRIRRLLGEAVQANMNMIRVWGGGFYEFDDFYDACDELGLLVWQDMMFSCSQYPSTPEFLANVDAEMRYQVKRLASHASIALWCGDNEIIGSLNWYEESKKDRDRYLVNYDRLNRAIEHAIFECDPDRRFWPSSPCTGALDYGDAWHDDTKGDMHFWSVWHEGKDFEHYYTVKPRFCSEFGFQSFPTMTTIARFAEPSQWNAMSPVMEFHQRDKRPQRPHRRDDDALFPRPEQFRGFRLSEPAAAGPRHRDRGPLLAEPEAAHHGHDLLAAQRRVAGGVLVEPRLLPRLEDAALPRPPLLRAGRHRLAHRGRPADHLGGQRPAPVRDGRRPHSEDLVRRPHARGGDRGSDRAGGARRPRLELRRAAGRRLLPRRRRACRRRLHLGYDSMLRTVVLPDKPKRFEFPEAKITSSRSPADPTPSLSPPTGRRSTFGPRQRTSTAPSRTRASCSCPARNGRSASAPMTGGCRR